VYELARGWKTDPDTIEILKTCALSDDELEVRQVAVRELARRWAPDPEITAWLAALPT